MLGPSFPNPTYDFPVDNVRVVSRDIVDNVMYRDECEDKISCHDKAYKNLQPSVDTIDPHRNSGRDCGDKEIDLTPIPETSVSGLSGISAYSASCFSAEHGVERRHWLLKVLVIQAVETKNFAMP